MSGTVQLEGFAQIWASQPHSGFVCQPSKGWWRVATRRIKNVESVACEQSVKELGFIYSEEKTRTY